MEIFSFDEEFQFVLEMVILKRNENGATLSEIRDDFDYYFGIKCEPIWGYRCWEQDITPLLTNVMCNISTKTLDNGCVLYYMDIDAAINKLSSDLPDNMALICQELRIDLAKLKNWEASLSSQSRSTNTSQSDSIRNTEPKSTSSVISLSPSVDFEFSGHVLIGDNFFLEVAQKDLNQRPIKGNVKQIGYCVSGQNIPRAIQNVSRSINKISQRGAIINLGSVDLLQGRELVDMAQDMYQLCVMLCDKGIFPLSTTLPPLANQRHNIDLENKRKLFNRMLMESFDCIDIERCFLSNCSSVLFDQYQSKPKQVSGTRHALVLWNHVGRQRVLKMMKRKVEDFHDANLFLRRFVNLHSEAT